ncbi:hypothetical protein Taro_034274, partial [Colocasia esculenta]|nr:hypothetical protein [Colocasia esculenta]
SFDVHLPGGAWTPTFRCHFLLDEEDQFQGLMRHILPYHPQDGEDVWSWRWSKGTTFSVKSAYEEPAFQELILLYTDEATCTESQNVEVMPLQLKIYERIPYPELPVIFPHKKLSFRILDTVRLDIASILGLLAYFVNYKFENILSSPSAIFLDIVAISALLLYVTRVALGYKQTWDRYQVNSLSFGAWAFDAGGIVLDSSYKMLEMNRALLVNRTLYEKTLASGFGSVHFLLDASEQQQYKEAILAYAILLHSEKCQVSCSKSLGDACERFMYDRFQEKVEMPTEKAIDTLLRLDIVREIPVSGRVGLKALPCLEAYEALRYRWDSLLS